MSEVIPFSSTAKFNELLFDCTDVPAIAWADAGRIFLSESSNAKTLMPEDMHRLFHLAANLKSKVPKQRSEVQKCNFGIIEFCCDEESEIGKVGRSANIDVLRITKSLDCMNQSTMHACMEFVKNHDRVHMHGSLPCTPWSTIQFLNIHLHGLSFRQKLHRARLLSLRQVAIFLILSRFIAERRGASSFEWPRSAQGCDKPTVQQ